MRITINVTDKHIQQGTIVDSSDCPIARALRSAGFKDASVCGDSVTLYSRRNPCAAMLTGKTFEQFTLTKVPNKVTKFVHAFDTEKKVKPFTFTFALSLSDITRLKFKPRLSK